MSGPGVGLSLLMSPVPQTAGSHSALGVGLVCYLPFAGTGPLELERHAGQPGSDESQQVRLWLNRPPGGCLLMETESSGLFRKDSLPFQPPEAGAGGACGLTCTVRSWQSSRRYGPQKCTCLPTPEHRLCISGVLTRPSAPGWQPRLPAAPQPGPREGSAPASSDPLHLPAVSPV